MCFFSSDLFGFAFDLSLGEIIIAETWFFALGGTEDTVLDTESERFLTREELNINRINNVNNVSLSN